MLLLPAHNQTFFYMFFTNVIYIYLYFTFVAHIGSRSETPGKFWDVVLEKDRKDQLDRLCEKWKSITESQGAEKCPT